MVNIQSIPSFDSALLTASLPVKPDKVRDDPEIRGRLAESTIGASLVNAALAEECGGSLAVVEVKSSARKTCLPGVAKFCR